MNVIKNASYRIAERFVQANIVKQEQKNVYAYGLELLLSSCIGVLILALVSAVAGKPILWIPYMLAFVPLRLTAGGYHANTHLGCILSFSLAYVAFCALGRWAVHVPPVALVVAAVVFAIVIFFSPVEAVNKPLKEAQRKTNRRLSLILCAVNLCIAAAGLFFGWYHAELYVVYIMGIAAAGLSMIVSVMIKFFHKMRGETNHEE